MGFLDSMSSLLGGDGRQNTPGAPAPSGMTNYGALSDPISTVGNVLATLRGGGAAAPSGATGGQAPMSGGMMGGGASGAAQAPMNAQISPEAAGIAAGMANQHLGQSALSAGLSGFAGALGGRQNAVLQNAKLQIEQQQWQLEAQKQQIEIHTALAKQKALEDFAKNQGTGTGGYPSWFHGPGTDAGAGPAGAPQGAAPPPPMAPQGAPPPSMAPPPNAPPVPPPVSNGDPQTPGVGPTTTPSPPGPPMPPPPAGPAGPGPGPIPPVPVGAGAGAPPPGAGAAPPPPGPPQPDLTVAGAGNAGPASADPSAPPPPPANAVTVAPSRSATPQFWSRVAPEENPFYLQARADNILSRINPMLDPQLQNSLRQQANTDRMMAKDIISRKYVMMNNGQAAMIPGILDNETAEAGAKAAATKSAEMGVENQNTLIDTQPTPGGGTVRATKAQVLQAVNSQPQPGPGNAGNGSVPTGGMPSGLAVAKQPDFVNQRVDQMWKTQDAMTDQYHARQDAIGRLQQMQGILQKYETGTFAENKAAAFAALKGAGIPITDDMQNNVNNYQEFQKLATKSVFNDVKNMGGRVLVSEIEGLTRANANPSLQPGANQAILGSAIGALKREDQYYKDFTGWHKQNPTAYDASDFEQNWNKNNPAIAYSEQGIKDTGAAGVPIPEHSQRVDGQVYVTPKGPARWVAGKGWQLQGAQ